VCTVKLIQQHTRVYRMIKYITSVDGKDCVTHVLAANNKNVSVVFTPEKRSYHADRMDRAYFTYGGVTVFDDMSISASSSHFAEILLTVELVNVIKEFNQRERK
jgi:hypothetical protein